MVLPQHILSAHGGSIRLWPTLLCLGTIVYGSVIYYYYDYYYYSTDSDSTVIIVESLSRSALTPCTLPDLPI